MTHSESPLLWDHAGHNIRAELRREEDPPRTVRGNAWCFDCDVPIEATWTRELGVQTVKD